MEIRWITSAPASAWHATAEILRGHELLDQQLSAALAEPVRELAGSLESNGIDAARFLEHMPALAASESGPAQRVQTALHKILGRQHDPLVATELKRHVIAVELAFAQVYPQATDELALRADPLRGQWEARGPGLLASLRRMATPDLLVERADVVLVQPATGGGGAAQQLYNSVRFEAVLANPRDDLPEVVRLGWLLGQLNLDLPMLHGDLHRDRWLELGPLALVPAILAAADQTELCRGDREAIAQALEFWRLDTSCAEVLSDWWDTYRTSRPPWHVALAALDQLVGHPE